MKKTPVILSAALAAGLGFPVISSGQQTETTKKTRTEVTSDDGTTTTTRTSTRKTFTSDVKDKTVQYFETHKSRPHGLPPALATSVEIERIPAEWRASTIETGYVIPEENRDYLAPVPPDLVEVLPQAEETIKYYLAGSNVLAVDTTKMTVVDSLRIPTIQYAQADATSTQTTQTEVAADGSRSTTTTKTTTFTPELRTKVMGYFETHKSRPYGLPPTIVEKVKVEKIPTAWQTTTIERGYVIPEEQRDFLTPVPTDLAEVLPQAGETTKYYVMGSNVVAVDTNKMVVVDAVKVPTITYKKVTTRVDSE